MVSQAIEELIDQTGRLFPVAPLLKRKSKNMSDYTKHLSFLFIVPNEFFSSAVKVTIPYEINVRYTLNYKGEVALNDYNVKPGMAKHIVNWEGLEQQMLEAAKNNAKGYKVPGAKRFFHTNYNNMYNPEANDLHREERIK